MIIDKTKDIKSYKNKTYYLYDPVDMIIYDVQIIDIVEKSAS